MNIFSSLSEATAGLSRRPNLNVQQLAYHAYAVALHMMYYNFVRIHSKL